MICLVLVLGCAPSVMPLYLLSPLATIDAMVTVKVR